MKVPYSWLKELVTFSYSPHELAERLTLLGLEVSTVEAQHPPFEGVVVGEVLECERHPEADKLSLTKVTDGTETYQVVCGASNCRKGLRVALAKVGAKLYDEAGGAFKIKKSKIRGVESFGMLCAEEELGLADSSDGIMELDSELALGTDLRPLYSETVIDIDLTPNLGYCNSIQGIAREISALTEAPVQMPSTELAEDSSRAAKDVTSVKVLAPEACPRYACRIIEGVKVGPSPEWLKRKLEASGMRSVNNIVDATNYVLLERGHPLHAFDLDTLEGERIEVRLANGGEQFETLDGETRTLTEEMLLICDAKKPVAIAGVMGGANSEVHSGSSRILIESAYFDPRGIRRTGRKLGLRTEASRRFEQGCDIEQVSFALDRVTGLIQELGGGTILSGMVDCQQQTLPLKEVACRHSRINHLLGTSLSVSEVEDIFRRLNLPFRWDSEDTYTIQVPSYRHDLNIEVDLIEEVARLYGYDNIPRQASRLSASRLPHAPIYMLERETRQRLIAGGLQELLTCDLIGPSLMNRVDQGVFPEEVRISVKNPTSLEQSVLRPSMLPGLLQVIKHNLDHQNKELSGFEVGHIHFRQNDELKEQSVVGLVLTGHDEPQSWSREQSPVDFFTLKGSAEELLEGLRVPKVQFTRSASPLLHPGRQAAIQSGELTLGTLGEVHPAILRRMDIQQRVYYAEINLHDLFPIRDLDIQMSALPVYPGSDRDWTVTVSEDMAASQMLQAIHSLPSKLLKDVSLLSVYRSERLGPDRKNMTFGLNYRSDKKTLAQEAVDREHDRLLGHVRKQLGDLILP